MAETILQVVGFPGLLFCSFLGFLYEGIDRRLYARMQHRMGPPIWQAFYDFGKLFFVKEDLTPAAAVSRVFNLAPILAVASSSILLLLIPISSARAVLASTGDLLVILALLLIPELAVGIGGLSSSNPYGAVGGSRSLTLLLAYEFPLILSVLSPVIIVGSLGLTEIVSFQAQHGWLVLKAPLATVALLTVLPAILYKVPFDAPLALYEIHDGPFIEYSGPKLALFYLAKHLEFVAITGLAVSLFFGGPESIHFGAFVLPPIVSFLLKTLVLLGLVSYIRAVCARLRIDQTLRFFWFGVAPIAALDLLRIIIMH